MQEDALERTAEIFGALATVSRLRILLSLADGEHTVTHIVRATGLSQPLVSQHLKALRALRLVQVVRSGREAFYSVDDEHVLQILQATLDHALEDFTQ